MESYKSVANTVTFDHAGSKRNKKLVVDSKSEVCIVWKNPNSDNVILCVPNFLVSCKGSVKTVVLTKTTATSCLLPDHCMGASTYLFGGNVMFNLIIIHASMEM